VTDARITPEPPPSDREAILEAVDALLRREADRARPSTWTLGGWIDRRVGLTDLGRWIEPDRRWVLSARLPRGGRDYPGLTGRGDAK